MTTTAIERHDASTTMTALTARLADAQERLTATGPEHARLRQERRDAFEAGTDTEPLDGRLARLDRDAQDLEAIIQRVTAELATATSAQRQEEIAEARSERTRVNFRHADIGRSAVTRIMDVMRDELRKEAEAYAALEAAHGHLAALEGRTAILFNNAIFARLTALLSNLEDGGTKDLDIELESARNSLAQLEASS